MTLQELPQHLQYRADAALVRQFTQFENAVAQAKTALSGAPATLRAPEAIKTFVLPLIEALGASLTLSNGDLANYAQFVLQQAGGNDEPQVFVGLDPDDAEALLDTLEEISKLLAGSRDAKKLGDVKPRIEKALELLADVEAGVSDATLDFETPEEEEPAADDSDLDDSPLEIG
jgi:hypothetical protein